MGFSSSASHWRIHIGGSFLVAKLLQQFLHDVRECPVRVQLRISGEPALQLRVSPRPRPREKMCEFELFLQNQLLLWIREFSTLVDKYVKHAHSCPSWFSNVVNGFRGHYTGTDDTRFDSRRYRTYLHVGRRLLRLARPAVTRRRTSGRRSGRYPHAVRKASRLERHDH